MQLKSIRDDLRHYMHVGSPHNRIRCADLNRVIEALGNKEADLELQLGREEDPLKRRHLKIELKVARMQRAKGIERLRILQDDRASAYAPPHGPTVADVTD